ncbi:MAG: PAS domain S-box protein, partial [Candidatus Heimdallarchaeaceae archaeon]
MFSEDSTIKLINSKMEKLSGYKKEEVEGLKSWKEFIPESEIEKMLEYNRKRKTNSSSVPNQYETKIITKNGDILSVLLAISQI